MSETNQRPLAVFGVLALVTAFAVAAHARGRQTSKPPPPTLTLHSPPSRP